MPVCNSSHTLNIWNCCRCMCKCKSLNHSQQCHLNNGLSITDATEKGESVFLPFGLLQASWENKTKSYINTMISKTLKQKLNWLPCIVYKCRYHANYLKPGEGSPKFKEVAYWSREETEALATSNRSRFLLGEHLRISKIPLARELLLNFSIF